MSMGKTLYPLLSTGSTQEDLFRHRLGPKESNQNQKIEGSLV